MKYRTKIISLVVTLFITSFYNTNLANTLKDYLIPVPKTVEVIPGSFQRNSGRIIIPSSLMNTGVYKMIKSVNHQLANLNIKSSIAAKPAVGELPLISIYLSPALASQEYKLHVSSDQINIEGGDESAVYYALQTFSQILQYAKQSGSISLVSIQDSPDFKRRGILLDISRNKVPTMESLEKLIDLFSSWKINELQLYTENTFAYHNHSVVWEGFSPMTAEEIIQLDKLCNDRYIDLVPNQTSLGHMDQWISHNEYKELSERMESYAGHVMSPVVPKTLNLMRELYAELLPNFSSKYFNINCDEAQDIGIGRSKEIVEKRGRGRVYLDYLVQLNNEIGKYGKTTLFWGDIILNSPELIPKIPKDMISLVWGYAADYPFNENCKKFSDADRIFYVCPGTSSWNSLVGRNQNAFDNLKNASFNGKKYNAIGFLNTDWGDGGHWQPLSVSYPAYLFGAAVSWGLRENEDIDVGRLIDRYIFEDESGTAGKALIQIGNAYLSTVTPEVRNASVFNQLIVNPNSVLPKGLSSEGLKSCIKNLDENLEKLLKSPMKARDAEIVKDEMKLAVALAQLGCKIGLARLSGKHRSNDIGSIRDQDKKALASEFRGLIQEHQRIWVLRNRSGGLQVSTKNLENGLSVLQNN